MEINVGRGGGFADGDAATQWRCFKARLHGTLNQEKKMGFTTTTLILPALTFISTKFHIGEKHETSPRHWGAAVSNKCAVRALQRGAGELELYLHTGICTDGN